MSVLLPATLREVQRKAFKVFTSELSINLILQRGPSRRAGEKDDLLSAVWWERSRWQQVDWPCSADPGTYYLKELQNPKGCAIIAEGQYLGAYEYGLHKGRPALLQKGPIKVHRDWDKDTELDLNPGLDEGMFGVNVHDDTGVAGAQASAGCPIMELKHQSEMLGVVRRSTTLYGPRVTLTVVNTA